MKKFVIFILVLLLTIPLLANDRKLYVDDFKNVIGDIEEENKLLAFANTLNIEELILYDLDKINRKIDLTSKKSNYILANFISKAKTTYGIKRITASGETAGFFIEVIHRYNVSRASENEKFDVYNLEFEYWNSKATYGNYYCENYLRKNGIPCTKKGAYTYYKESLHVLRLLSNEYKNPVLIQAYINKYSPEEIEKIEPYVDVILVTCYESSLNKLKAVAKKNLGKLNGLKNKNTEISILMSSEPIFLGGFFKYNSLSNTEESIETYLAKHSAVDALKLSFTYYNYTNLADSYEYQYFLRTGKPWAYNR